MDPIQKISIYYDNLTNKEKRTCDLILGRPEVVIGNPIAVAAEIYDVSAASIVRLSKKLGYKGYSELCYALEEYYRRESKLGKHQSITAKVVECYQACLQQMLMSIREQDIQKLVSWIKVKNVKALGTGNSALAGEQLVFALYEYSIWSECLSDSIKMNYYEKMVTDQDLIIIFSVSGKHDQYFREVKKWRTRGAKIVLVTTNQDSPWLNFCDMSFILPIVPVLFHAEDKKMHYLEGRIVFYVFIELLTAYLDLD